jgi:hypothetical protein
VAYIRQQIKQILSKLPVGEACVAVSAAIGICDAASQEEASFSHEKLFDL